MQDSRATKNPSFRGSSHIYSPTVPSSRIRVPKHCLAAKAFDAWLHQKKTQIPAILVICIFNISLGNHCQSSYLMITFGVANHKSVAIKWRKLAWLQYQIKLLYYKMGKRVVHRIVMKCLNFRMIRPMVQKLQRRLDWSATPSKGAGILASTMQVLFIPLHIKTKRRKTTPCCYLGTDIQRATKVLANQRLMNSDTQERL